MSRNHMLLLGFCVVLSLSASTAMAQAGDLDRMQGEWRVVSKKWNSIEDATATPRMRIEGDQWTQMDADGAPVCTVTIRLDPTKNPPRFDALYDLNDGKHAAMAGIYNLDGDELIIHFNGHLYYSYAGRPDSFDATVSGERFDSLLWRLQRVTEARPD